MTLGSFSTIVLLIEFFQQCSGALFSIWEERKLKLFFRGKKRKKKVCLRAGFKLGTISNIETRYSISWNITITARSFGSAMSSQLHAISFNSTSHLNQKLSHRLSFYAQQDDKSWPGDVGGHPELLPDLGLRPESWRPSSILQIGLKRFSEKN